MVPVAQMWDLARQWYAGRLEPGWRGLTPRDKKKILDSVGLKGDFWKVE